MKGYPEILKMKIFEESKPGYEETLKKCGYKAKLQYIQPKEEEHGKSFSSTHCSV